MLRTDKDCTPTGVNLDPRYLETLSGRPWFALKPDERTTVIVATSLGLMKKPKKCKKLPGIVVVGKMKTSSKKTTLPWWQTYHKRRVNTLSRSLSTEN